MPPAPAPYHVLSIDGGGIRGLLTTIVLQRLVATPGLGHLLDAADLIAGTSTGGLLALGIAHGLGLATIRALYVNKGPKIFDDSWLDDLVDLGKIRGADYDIEPLQRELRALFGGTTLGQLKKRVLITVFDLDNEDERPDRRTWKPKLFHNFLGPNTDRGELAYKVGLYTSAAPTNGIADYQCHQILRDRYQRLAPVFPPGTSVPMDGVKKIPYLIEFAEALPLDETVDWLRRHWAP